MGHRVVQDVPDLTQGMTGEHISLKHGCTGPRQDMQCENPLQAEMKLLLKVQAYLEQVLCVSVHATVVFVLVRSGRFDQKRQEVIECKSNFNGGQAYSRAFRKTVR